MSNSLSWEGNLQEWRRIGHVRHRHNGIFTYWLNDLSSQGDKAPCLPTLHSGYDTLYLLT